MPAGTLHLRGGNEHADGRRDHGDGLCEDDGQHAAEVDLDGDVSGLATVHLPAHHALCVLNGDLALGIADEHDENNQSQHADDEQDCDERIHCLCIVHSNGLFGPVGHVRLAQVLLDTGNDAHDHRRTTGNDTSEQDDGDAVADTELRNLLAQPHQEDSACSEGDHDDQAGPETFAGNQTVALDQGVVTKALQQTNTDGGVPGNGLDLLLALFAAVLSQSFQSGDRNGQQLDDNGGVDIGLDGQCEQSRIGKCGTAQGVEQTEDSPGVCLDGLLKIFRVDVGDRDSGAQTEDQQSKDDKQELVAQIRKLPCVTDGL